MTNIYITYNPQLKDFLKKKGLKFMVCGLNPNPPHKTLSDAAIMFHISEYTIYRYLKRAKSLDY